MEELARLYGIKIAVITANQQQIFPDPDERKNINEIRYVYFNGAHYNIAEQIDDIKMSGGRNISYYNKYIK